MSHVELSTTVRQIVLLEKTATSLALQISALKRDGVPAIALAGCEMARDAIKRDVNRWKRQVAKDYRDLPVVAWAKGVHGLGDAVTLVLGIAPPLTDFATVSKLWKYSGLAPGQKATKGQKLNYSPLLKSFVTIRIADPCIKHRASPYRAVYDNRRVLTVATHPEWTDGHSHNDARRIVAKAVLRDMWLVAHGKEAKIGSGSALVVVQPNRVLPPLTISDNTGEASARGSLLPYPPVPPPSPSSRKKNKAANRSLVPRYSLPSSPAVGQRSQRCLETRAAVAPLARRRSSPVLETV